MASEDEKCQAVVKAALSKAQDVREETELIMKPFANWEEYLMAAPLSIAILGQLIFISAGQRDFSVNKKPPPKGFKHISHPESFRACLCQVSNEGWHAFAEAHVSMDQIRLLLASMPERLKLMVQTLFQEVEIANTMLPGQLKRMKTVVVKCTALAHSVRDKYKNMISLIQELLLACTNAKMGYERELEEVQTALKQANIREEVAKKNMKILEEYHNKMKKHAEDSLNFYKKAMDEIPSGWEAIIMKIVEGMANAGTNVITSWANLVQFKFGGSAEDGPSRGSAMPNSEFQSPLPAMRICISSVILNYASGLKDNVVKQDRINFGNVYDKKTGQVKTNWVKKAFLDLKDDIYKEESCQLKEKALNICTFAVDICEKLEQMAKSAKIGKGEERATIKNIEELYQQAAAFHFYSRIILRNLTFTPKPPNMAGYQQESTGVRSTHLKVERSREMYNEIQGECQKSSEDLKKQNEELVEILCQMECCKVKEIDFETALKMLTEGLKAMGKVKEQWEKMIWFFKMISNIVDVCLSQKMSDLLEFVVDVPRIKDYPSKSYVTGTICSHVFSASSVTHLVHMFAETYTEVSGKYLMDQVSSLGRLLTLEHADPDFNSERHALSQGCEKALGAIYTMVVEKKEEFDRNLLTRMETIAIEMKAVLPPISVREEKKDD